MLRTLNTASMWRSRLKLLGPTSNTCLSCRGKRETVVEEHVRSIPEERKHVSQLDGLDLNRLQPQYRHVKALETAPDDVRKIFTLKYGGKEERMESRYLDYAEKLQCHRNDHDSPEMRISRLTLEIRDIQEQRTQMLYEPKPLQEALRIKFKQRNNLLLELKSKNFEKYCLTMEVLDLKAIYGPEYDFRYTQRVKNIADMKTRVFAEVKRRENQKIQRSKEVSQLQAEILEKLKSGEIEPPSGDELSQQ